ncbi:MAG: hypothetical protein R3B91_08285 [Planctomycetaceae bacterium]
MASLTLDDQWVEQTFLANVNWETLVERSASRQAGGSGGDMSRRQYPRQTESWADCKAAYRLFDEDDVSFEALCEPHWQSTRCRTESTWLLIGDTTQVEFGIFREVCPGTDRGWRWSRILSAL